MDYEKLTDRELDTAIAERLMGWTHLADNSNPALLAGRPAGKVGYSYVPAYHQDDNAARLVRERIVELDLVRKFMHILWKDSLEPWWDCEFALMQLNPRQQCIAALKAMEAKPHE